LIYIIITELSDRSQLAHVRADIRRLRSSLLQLDRHYSAVVLTPRTLDSSVGSFDSHVIDVSDALDAIDASDASDAGVSLPLLSSDTSSYHGDPVAYDDVPFDTSRSITFVNSDASSFDPAGTSSLEAATIPSNVDDRPLGLSSVPLSSLFNFSTLSESSDPYWLLPIFLRILLTLWVL